MLVWHGRNRTKDREQPSAVHKLMLEPLQLSAAIVSERCIHHILMLAGAEKKQRAKDAKKSGNKPDQKAAAKAAQDTDMADAADGDKVAQQQDDAAAPAEKAEGAAGTDAKDAAAGNTAASEQHVCYLHCSTLPFSEMPERVLAVLHVWLHRTGHLTMSPCCTLAKQTNPHSSTN
jgi:hypothetical protein